MIFKVDRVFTVKQKLKVGADQRCMLGAVPHQQTQTES